MKHVFQFKKPLLFAALLCIFGATIAWQLPQSKSNNNIKPQQNTGNSDTGKPGDDADQQALKMDKQMQDMDLQMKEVDEQMKNIDMEKIQQETQEALRKIDWDEMGKTIEKSMQEADKAIAKIDFKDIQKQTQKAMANIDWKEINKNIEEAIKDAKKQVDNIDTAEINRSMREAQKAMQSAEIRNLFDSAKMQEMMRNANREMEKSKSEMKQLNDLTTALQNDGLVDKSTLTIVQLKDGYLYINGNKQSKETTEKYSKYYGGKKSFMIKLNDED
jgi:hypothetical protein